MIKVAIIGTVMAGAMLLMMHDRIMAVGFDLSGAALLFAGLHVAAGLLLLSLALLIPALRQRIVSHRPTAAQAIAMVTGAVVMDGGTRIRMHGGLA